MQHKLWPNSFNLILICNSLRSSNSFWPYFFSAYSYYFVITFPPFLQPSGFNILLQLRIIYCYFGEFVDKLLFFLIYTHTHIKLLVSLYGPTLMYWAREVWTANVSYCCYSVGVETAGFGKIRNYGSWLECRNRFSVERKTKNSSSLTVAGEAVRANLESSPRCARGPLTNGPAATGWTRKTSSRNTKTRCNLMRTVDI